MSFCFHLSCCYPCMSLFASTLTGLFQTHCQKGLKQIEKIIAGCQQHQPATVSQLCSRIQRRNATRGWSVRYSVDRTSGSHLELKNWTWVFIIFANFLRVRQAEQSVFSFCDDDDRQLQMLHWIRTSNTQLGLICFCSLWQNIWSKINYEVWSLYIHTHII